MSLEDGRVVSNFITQALTGRPITIYGDGSQTRSFCYVDDLVAAFASSLGTDSILLGPLNVGNPSEISILQIAQKIIKLTDSKSEICFRELPLDDPKQRKPDIEKIQMELGWSPKINLDNGLGKTIEDFAKRL
jgi:UDP-glucuronate decarboxylase